MSESPCGQRWGKTDPGKRARELLQKALQDKTLLEAVAQQGGEDETKSVSAQAKAFERFDKIDQAIEAWEILAKNYADTDIGRNAEAQIIRLRAKRKDRPNRIQSCARLRNRTERSTARLCTGNLRRRN